MNGELGDLRLQLERLVYESKEAAITADAMKEQNGDLVGELEEMKVRFRLLFVSLRLLDFEKELIG